MKKLLEFQSFPIFWVSEIVGILIWVILLVWLSVFWVIWRVNSSVIFWVSIYEILIWFVLVFSLSDFSANWYVNSSVRFTWSVLSNTIWDIVSSSTIFLQIWLFGHFL